MSYTYDDEIYSDLHKDAYGCRPGEAGFAYWDSLNPAEKQRHWDSLCATMSEGERQREEYEKEAIVRFEARLADVIACGAGNRETAIRWVFQAENDQYVFGDPDLFCYSHGLPYGYFRKVA